MGMALRGGIYSGRVGLGLLALRALFRVLLRRLVCRVYQGASGLLSGLGW